MGASVIRTVRQPVEPEWLDQGPRSDDHVPFRLQLILSLVKPEGVGRSGAIFLNIMCHHVFSG